jgi:heme iron utilization protein
MMRTEDRATLTDLVASSRQAALGTVHAGAPFVSMVLYALMRDAGAAPAALIHVSKLAAHTRHLLAEPRAALLITRPDLGDSDPQALPRVTLSGLARPLGLTDPTYAAARAAYLARLPTQEHLFALTDFTLFRIELREARFVGGFARALTLDAAALAEALR